LENIDIVFHLAAKILLAPDSDGSVWKINVEGTGNIAEACLAKNIRLVHCSSHHALNRYPLDKPMDETRELALNDRMAYHRSKAHAEKKILDLVSKGLDAVIVNPGTLIGPYDYEPSILARALLDLAKGKLPAIMEGLSDYADVRDVADGIILAAEKGQRGERYFLTGAMLSMPEVSDLVEKITGRKTTKTILPLWLMHALLPFIKIAAKINGKEPLFTKEMLEAAQSPNEVIHTKAEKELGFKVRPIEESFRDSFDWYKSEGWI
jgi:dihydroflavonol-4-reductase